MYGAQDPGNWQVFKTRQDIKPLPLMEQKSKFIQEQLNFDNAMAEFAAQAQVAGISYNPIESIVFDGTPLNTISGFTAGLEVTFKNDITVTGVPSIVVPNGQQGGGSSSSVTYTFDSAISSKVLFFTYVQAANANGTGAIAANGIKANEGLSITSNINNDGVVDTYDDVMAWATGTGGVGGVDVDVTIIVATIPAVGNRVASVQVTNSNGGTFQPGNTLSIAGTALGGTGTLVCTILASDLTGDVLTLSGGDRFIALNGGSINSVGGRPASDVFTSNENDTATAG